MNNNTSGKFISLEGIEGVGKSTNMDYLANKLAGEKIEYVRTREPGGTEVAEDIRQILLKSYSEPVLAKTEALLLYAGRYQHVEHVIKPALNEGKWVLSDRFYDATLAYQGGGREQPLESIFELNKWVLGDFKPDYTIVFDAPVEIALERIQKRRHLDRIEQEDQQFFNRIRNLYLFLAEREPERFWVVDASQSIESVQKQIDYIVAEIQQATINHAVK